MPRTYLPDGHRELQVVLDDDDVELAKLLLNESRLSRTSIRCVADLIKQFQVHTGSLSKAVAIVNCAEQEIRMERRQ